MYVLRGGTLHYILDDEGNPKQAELIEWAAWFETCERIVEQTKLPIGITVSTVFLGIDHNWSGGTPVLWETMIFGGPYSQGYKKYQMYQMRYSSREQAEKGHARAVKHAMEWRAEDRIDNS